MHHSRLACAYMYRYMHACIQDHVIHAYSSTVQMNPPWGIDRLDSSSLPLDSAYRYQYTGRGVKVFVVDSGIRSTHQDFGGRVVCGMSVFSGTSCQDGQGHGTHVAGTVGGTAYGVAKDAEIVAVRVLDNRGDGSISGLISALDYIRRQKSSSPRTPMVVNLSLGSDDPSPSLDAAVDSTVAAGLVVVVAAGNYVGNACSTSPASAKNAITVAATDSQDGRLGMSNFGSCVSIFAPGSRITSAWSSSDTSSSTISGTSMGTFCSIVPVCGGHVWFGTWTGVFACLWVLKPWCGDLSLSLSLASKLTRVCVLVNSF